MALTLGWPTGSAADQRTGAEQAAHDLVRAGRHQAAIEEFEKLYASRPEPRFVLNIAAIYQHYLPGRCPDTMRALARFFVACAACPLRAQAETLQSQAERTCTGWVEIVVDPPAAQVRIDDGPPAAAGEVALVEGAHIVSASLEGHAPVERSFVVEGGQTRRLDLVLSPAPSPADRLFDDGRGRMDAGQFGQAGALFTRGEALEPSPRFALALARAHLSVTDCPGAAAALDRFEARCPDCVLAAGGRQTRAAWRTTCAPPAQRDSGPGIWTWIGLGVGVAGAAAGGFFHTRYLDGVETRDAAMDAGASIPRVRTLHDEVIPDYQLMQAGYITGAVGLSAALILWWLDGADEAAAGPDAQAAGIRVGIGLRSVSFEGRF